VILAVVGAAILFLCVALIVAVIRDPGPQPDDVAMAYELAWDHLDFESLWTLSGRELHDGLDRAAFVAAKRAAYASRPELGRLAREVSLDAVTAARDNAVARSRVVLRDGDVVYNQIQLARREGRWLVVGYRLESEAPQPRG
jgi:hypothetical protein